MVEVKRRTAQRLSRPRSEARVLPGAASSSGINAPERVEHRRQRAGARPAATARLQRPRHVQGRQAASWCRPSARCSCSTPRGRWPASSGRPSSSADSPRTASGARDVALERRRHAREWSDSLASQLEGDPPRPQARVRDGDDPLLDRRRHHLVRHPRPAPLPRPQHLPVGPLFPSSPTGWVRLRSLGCVLFHRTSWCSRRSATVRPGL